jgi:hypothetical protein
MQILIDHNIEGFAPLLLGVLAKEGWVELLQLQFLYLPETTLHVDSDDTTVWRYVQSAGALLLTSNRNRQNDTSLQATIERENHPTALPVISMDSCLPPAGSAQDCRNHQQNPINLRRNATQSFPVSQCAMPPQTFRELLKHWPQELL